MTSYKLFLDEKRKPIDCIKEFSLPAKLYKFNDWLIARSYHEFVFTIAEQWTLHKAYPSFISFCDELKDKSLAKKCIDWLIQFGIDNKIYVPIIVEHNSPELDLSKAKGRLEHIQKLDWVKTKRETDEKELINNLTEIIHVPKLDNDSKRVIIRKWHKEVGDKIAKGDLLAELETKDSTMDLESYSEGVLLYKVTEYGGKLKVDDVMLVIGICKRNEK